ncbi:MAG: helix-turn-helix domain-containing protein [Myxococcales bacterium]|nr:helix-turn-helix domain-containing protein [Myxococcales bacterium]
MTTLGTLTSRQTALLTAIIDFMVDNGYCPCYRELQEMLGLKSKNGVSDHIKVLEQKGYLRVIKGCARGLVVLYTPAGEPFRHVWQDLTNLEAEVSHA